MSENFTVSGGRLHGFWALTNRELKKWYQAPGLFVISIIQPVVWMVLMGKALNVGALIPSNIKGLDPAGALQQALGTPDYFSFMAIGMIAFTTVFSTAFISMRMIWDRRLGFMSKVVTAPVYRPIITLSKVVSTTLRAVVQAGIVAVVALALGLRLGTNFTPLCILGVFAIVFMMGIGMSSFFAILSLRTTKMEAFQAILQLVALPLLFASNCFFPAELMPDWLKVVATANPVSYMIDAVRQLTVFSGGYGPLALDFGYVGAFTMVMVLASAFLSRRLLEK